MTARHKPAPVGTDLAVVDDLGSVAATTDEQRADAIRTAAGEALDATELRDLIHALGGTRSDAEMARQRIREARAERHRRAS